VPGKLDIYSIDTILFMQLFILRCEVEGGTRHWCLSSRSLTTAWCLSSIAPHPLISAMTQEATSECSITDPELFNLEKLIETTASRLRKALADVAMLRKQLRELLIMKEEDAVEQVERSRRYLESVREQKKELSSLLGQHDHDAHVRIIESRVHKILISQN